MTISKSIEELRKQINCIAESSSKNLEEYSKKLDELKKEINQVSNFWVGNWVQYQDFYQDFITPSKENIQLTYNQIDRYILIKSQINFQDIEDSIEAILKEYKNFNDHLITELSIIKSNSQFSEQLSILEKLENYEWVILSKLIIQTQKPKTAMVDHNTAQRLLSKGLKTPPHISLDADIISSASKIASMREYIKLSKRFIREIELLLNAENDDFISLENPINHLNQIFNNFHDVARLLINRHANRETIKINDEYDVQDLIRSLLKIFFDDVRPEEFAPSYAGRNTRIDFLLKKEKIVIEVKKTRETLKDKEIGDELLQDIARYRNHPDCNTLFCFVYDPQGFISNPRGLEDDLSSESNEKMKIYVSIRP